MTKNNQAADQIDSLLSDIEGKHAKKASSLSFLEHLDELRSRVIKCLIVFFIAFLAIYPQTDKILNFIIKSVGKLFFTAPADAFMARVHITLVTALCATLPYILYHVWMFLSLGLTEKERKYVVAFVPFSFLFFIAGVLFAYYVAIPISMNFLLSFSSEVMQPMITVKNYISYVGSLVLAFGVVFELPLILMFLARIGIATPAFLIQKRRHAIVLILIISAIITPPDVISQIVMAAPLLVLYELGIIATRFACRSQ